MLALRRDRQRRRVQRGRQDHRHTFFPRDQSGPLARGFGSLVAFDELRLPPGDSTEPSSRDEMEVVTYVFEGALSQEDTAADSSVIQAGEFQHMSTGRRRHHTETSVSGVDWAHVFRISLRPDQVGLGWAHEERRFTVAQRRNWLCVVASPDGREESLRIHQDALVYSATVEPGYHLVHELRAGRSAWLHVVHGQVTLQDLVLTEGDGVGVTGEPSLSLTVHDAAEVLLVDLGPAAPIRGRRGSSPPPPPPRAGHGARAAPGASPA